MKLFFRFSLILILFFFTGFKGSFAQSVKYKCMIQMINYTGEEAYIVISLIDKEDQYEKTLYMLGPDKKWYSHLKDWHKSFQKKPANISAVTGASVAGGDRSVITLELDKAKIDAGYKLRFESAVEDKEYFSRDLEIELTTEALGSKNEGKGYIRFVRFSPS